VFAYLRTVDPLLYEETVLSAKSLLSIVEAAHTHTVRNHLP